MYFFLNAMVTLSAVVFLVAPGTELAAVAVLLMDDAGDTAQAAAMSVLIIAIGLGVRLGYWALMRGVTRRTQACTQARHGAGIRRTVTTVMDIGRFRGRFFEVLQETARSQTAVMTIEPGRGRRPRGDACRRPGRLRRRGRGDPPDRRRRAPCRGRARVC